MESNTIYANWCNSASCSREVIWPVRLRIPTVVVVYIDSVVIGDRSWNRFKWYLCEISLFAHISEEQFFNLDIDFEIPVHQQIGIFKFMILKVN